MCFQIIKCCVVFLFQFKKNVVLSFYLFFPQRYINWCFKKEKKAKWAQVILQESEENASSNSGGKITYFSKIQYHVTVFDSDVHFLCEISKSQICGTGFTFVQTIVHVDKRKGNICR